MSEHIDTRKKIKNICRISEFEAILDDCVLTDEEKDIMRLYYLKGKSFSYIADMLGYSECTVKRRHQNVLKKINKIL